MDPESNYFTQTHAFSLYSIMLYEYICGTKMFGHYTCMYWFYLECMIQQRVAEEYPTGLHLVLSKCRVLQAQAQASPVNGVTSSEKPTFGIIHDLPLLLIVHMTQSHYEILTHSLVVTSWSHMANSVTSIFGGIPFEYGGVVYILMLLRERGKLNAPPPPLVAHALLVLLTLESCPFTSSLLSYMRMWWWWWFLSCPQRAWVQRILISSRDRVSVNLSWKTSGRSFQVGCMRGICTFNAVCLLQSVNHTLNTYTVCDGHRNSPNSPFFHL